MASLLLGRSTPSEPRSREAARTCAGLDRRAATEAIMIAVICNLSSSHRDMTEARAIGQLLKQGGGPYRRPPDARVLQTDQKWPEIGGSNWGRLQNLMRKFNGLARKPVKAAKAVATE